MKIKLNCLLIILLCFAIASCNTTSSNKKNSGVNKTNNLGQSNSPKIIYEIRSYHYLPEKFEIYKKWAIEEALPYLRANLNVIGFWVDNGLTPELTGEDPIEHKHGVANITWIIEWKSEEARKIGFERLENSPQWKKIWDNHPDSKGYLQMEARFTEAL